MFVKTNTEVRTVMMGYVDDQINVNDLMFSLS